MLLSRPRPPLERNVLTPKPKGIAARAGHWSARHRKTAIFGWLAFIVIVFMVGQSLGQKTPSSPSRSTARAGRPP